MHLKRIVTVFFLSVMLWGVPTGAAAEQVWVSSFNATLNSDKTATSETLARLEVGDALTVIEKEDRWYRVTTADGKKGWIYRGKVSSEPPASSGEKSGDDSVGKLLTGLTGSRIGSDPADTSRSMRMLSVEKKKKNTSKSAQAYENALESVLSRRIPDARVDQFLQAGKIGEYAP